MSSSVLGALWESLGNANPFGYTLLRSVVVVPYSLIPWQPWSMFPLFSDLTGEDVIDTMP